MNKAVIHNIAEEYGSRQNGVRYAESWCELDRIDLVKYQIVQFSKNSWDYRMAKLMYINHFNDINNDMAII
jgi:hypothetical protein